jgi:hypothetical protein
MWIRNGYGYLWCLVYLSLGITPIFIHKAYLSKIWLMMNVACILIENIHATFYLVKLSFKSPKQAGDATSLQQATLLPASIWALFFLSISIVATFISLFAEHTLKFKIY